jgi:NAD(P)-dependent dehydrogenase (short-subunit alcohol dehydrogenase family)
MASRTWLITGVSSGFGRELTEQLLGRGDRVVGTVRDAGKVKDLLDRYPHTFQAPVLDVTDNTAVRAVVDGAFAEFGRIDVVVSNAGYGLFGAAEELTDAQVDHIIATNLTGSIQLIRAALPHLRAQGGGRIIQISSLRRPGRVRRQLALPRPASGGSKGSQSRSRRRSPPSASA